MTDNQNYHRKEVKRNDLWKIANDEDSNEKGVILHNKIIKIYEITALISVLTCGSFISLSNTNFVSTPYNNTVVFIYDIVRGYGIIFSIICVTISITFCILISATPYKYTYDLVNYSSFVMSIPLPLVILILILLIICVNLHFDIFIIYFLSPVSLLSIIGCLTIYFNTRNFLFDKIKNNIDTLDDIDN